MSSFVSQWNEFFLSRIVTCTGDSNSFLRIRDFRIFYGLGILFGRIMLSLDFKMFVLFSYHVKSCGALIHTDCNIIITHPVSTIHVTSDEKLPVK